MIGFEGAIAVEARGHSGGLAMLWKNKEKVTLNSLSNNHIDVTVEVHGLHKFRLTGFYGEPNRAKRYETWNLLRRLSTEPLSPWCIIGNMNNVLNQLDKRGGRLYPNHLIQGFQSILDDCNLHDLASEGYQFTWERSCGPDERIEIKLDRALINDSLMAQFAEAKLTNLEISTSDHDPIFLEPMVVTNVISVAHFRFENAWLKEPMCKKIMEDTWHMNQGKTLQDKIVICSVVLQKWGKEITGCFKNCINQCKMIMKMVKGRTDANSRKLYKEESKKLKEIYSQQEIFWRQRSKQLWLREGDQNSKFFHSSTKMRRKINHITFLANNADVQNSVLLDDIDTKEVKDALFHMHPDKSPGSDGMSPGFYQKYWSTMGEDVVNVVKKFFANGTFDKHLSIL
ncbi:uncharacterized protein LOC141699636 [Apium graveolens]|uniref:uncharacterized protein LOC141699636 n=1 Tax=Apium graveolens TaxID=4045 RepID=UPI003D78BBB9